jgi:hypothetical protein
LSGLVWSGLTGPLPHAQRKGFAHKKKTTTGFVDRERGEKEVLAHPLFLSYHVSLGLELERVKVALAACRAEHDPDAQPYERDMAAVEASARELDERTRELRQSMNKLQALRVAKASEADEQKQAELQQEEAAVVKHLQARAKRLGLLRVVALEELQDALDDLLEQAQDMRARKRQRLLERVRALHMPLPKPRSLRGRR